MGPDPRLSDCESLDGRAAADDCYQRAAVSAVNVAHCERIVGPRVKNTCFQRLATLSTNAELCAKIDETLARNRCRADVARKPSDAGLLLEQEIADPVRPAITRVSDNEFAITRAALERLRDPLNPRPARIVPELEHGKNVGLKIYGVHPDSWMHAAGLQNGDSVRTMNGFDLTSPERALEAYASLRTAEAIDVELVRRGTPMHLLYTVK